jgi:hypothetical protein
VEFPAGACCQDLRVRFQQVANCGNASFYSYLAYAKQQSWIVADGKTRRHSTIYSLNPDGSWRPPPIGEGIERHQFEHILTMRTERIEQLEAINRRLTDSCKAIAAGEAAGTAVSALVEIMYDSSVSIRGRLQAAENLLAFKTPTAVAEHAKQFLAAIFLDPGQNVDHRLAATAALRRSEDVRLMPPIERPDPAPLRDIDPEKEREARHAEFLRKKEHCNRLTDEIARQFGYRPPD